MNPCLYSCILPECLLLLHQGFKSFNHFRPFCLYFFHCVKFFYQQVCFRHTEQEVLHHDKRNILLAHVGALPVFRLLYGSMLDHIFFSYLRRVRPKHHTALLKLAFERITHWVTTFGVQIFDKLVFLSFAFYVCFFMNFLLDKLFDGHCSPLFSVLPLSLLTE
jgi:hypothetical protein